MKVLFIRQPMDEGFGRVVEKVKASGLDLAQVRETNANLEYLLA